MSDTPTNGSSSSSEDQAAFVSRRLIRTLVGLSAAVFMCVYVLSGICVVKPEQEALVTRFGRYHPPLLPPGTHYQLPYPVDRVTLLQPNQVKSVTVGARAGAGSSSTASTTKEASGDRLYVDGGSASQYLTGDENIVHIALNVQYKIDNPPHYLFQTASPDRLVEIAAETALTNIVAKTHVDDLLTSGKQWVLSKVKEQAQEQLNDLGAGIMVIATNFANVSPPGAVADAFKDVASALEDRDRLVNEAQGDYNEDIPRARGESSRQVQEAMAEKTGRVNRARGDADRYLSILREYEQAGHSETALVRLYLEHLEEALPGSKKYVIDNLR